MNNDLNLDSWLKKMASEHQPELPAPGLVWWRAQILRKQAEKERVERPLAVMRMIAVVACVVVVLALWVSQGRSLWGFVSSSGLVALLPLLLGGAAITAVLLALMWNFAART